jgi:hypothetical protein
MSSKGQKRSTAQQQGTSKKQTVGSQHELCLSFDIGTVNTGVCLYDPNINRILYWDAHEMMEPSFSAAVKSRQAHANIEFIMQKVEPLIGTKHFWVLIERQAETVEAFKRRLAPNWAIQYIIAEYFHARNERVYVDIVDASLKGKFFHIHDGNTLKKQVEEAAKAWVDKNKTNGISDQALMAWESAASPKPKQDMADAFVQMWVYYFANRDDAMNGNTYAVTDQAVKDRQRKKEEEQKKFDAQCSLEVLRERELERDERRAHLRRSVQERAELIDLATCASLEAAIHALFSASRHTGHTNADAGHKAAMLAAANNKRSKDQIAAALHRARSSVQSSPFLQEKYALPDFSPALAITVEQLAKYGRTLANHEKLNNADMNLLDIFSGLLRNSNKTSQTPRQSKRRQSHLRR